MSGYIVATQIVERLSDESKLACISALKFGEQGQSKLAAGDWGGALEMCRKAQAGFSKIPEARPLLGVTMADMAAALGNQGQHAEAKRVAEDALPLVAGEQMLRMTEGTLHMTIGIGCFLEEEEEKGAEHLSHARRLFRQLPDGGRMLGILDTNEQQLSSAPIKAKHPWWKFW